MLNGIYRHSVDAKGRMAVPVKFRAELGDSFFLTVGLDSCLYIFSQTEWEKFNTAIRSTLSFTAAEKLSRFFNAYSFEVEPDLQGRVIIPTELRNRAGIGKQAVVIGASNHAEIWEPAKWDEAQKAITDEDIRGLLDKSITFKEQGNGILSQARAA